MTYQYKVVPFIGRNRGRLSAEDVASQLGTLISQHVADGWEFHQLSDVNIEVRPGCIAGLFGASAQYVRFDQLIFRMNEEPLVRAAERPRDKLDDFSAESPNLPIANAPVVPTESVDDGGPQPPRSGDSKFAAMWRQKSDAQIRQAVGSLHEYTEESRHVVLAEFQRRSLDPTTESERAALDAIHDSDHPQSTEAGVDAGRDDETEDSLAYCYHCGSDVPPGSSRCPACRKNL